MGMGQTNVSAFLTQVSNIQAERGQDVVDVAIVDEAETVKPG